MVSRGLIASLVLFFCHIGSLAAATPAAPKLTAKGVEFFETRVRPVLVQRCYACHSSNGKEVKGGLLLDTREGILKGGESGAAVIPGEPEESLLLKAVRHEEYEMPPGDKLPDNVILDLEKWIEMGAPDPRTKSDANRKVSLTDARKFWSFQPVKKTAPPKVKNESWPQSEIDRFILAKLEAVDLVPVGDANKATLLRRLSFDLVGLPPTPEEIADFQRDQSPDAYAKVVDRLLTSPQFGERWGRHWLDAARFGESSGKERNVPFQYAWRYRDYVIDAFANDMPYDRFVREQVAGDLLPAKTAEERNRQLTATGFLAIGTKGLNERNARQYAADVADEQLDVTMRAVLGTTVACARCHDHKFDPIPQTDYYAVAGIFLSTDVLAGVTPGNNNTGGYKGKIGHLVDGPISASKASLSAEQKKELEKLEGEQKETHQKIVVIEQAGQALTAKLAAKGGDKDLRERREKMLKNYERLKERAVEIQKEMKAVVTGGSSDGDPVMIVRDSNKAANAKVNIRGEVDQLGPEVPRGIPTVLALGRSPRIETDGSGRLQLAAWLSSKENPLTARVMANRVWSHLMGRGIVESLDNFGSLGDEPTHPELLDYLAAKFVERGWSVKKLVREIVLTRTYRLSSEHHAANYAIDADNRNLWRMSRRRLEAEAIRDAMLASSGKLDLSRPKESPVEKLPVEELGRGKNLYTAKDESNHRSIYLPLLRGYVPETLSVFDAADPSLPVAQRDVTIVPTQALFLMNNRFVLENCRALARQSLSLPNVTDSSRIDYLFLRCLGRVPSSTERTQTASFLASYSKTLESKGDPEEARITAIAAFCQTLFASGEFRYVY